MAAFADPRHDARIAFIAPAVDKTRLDENPAAISAVAYITRHLGAKPIRQRMARRHAPEGIGAIRPAPHIAQNNTVLPEDTVVGVFHSPVAPARNGFQAACFPANLCR